MKRFTAILLIALFLSSMMKDVAIYVSFKVNQKYIAENICINYDIPQVMCHGKCYLSDKLEEEKQKEQTPAQGVEEYKELIVFLEPTQVHEPDELTQKKTSAHALSTWHPQNFYTSIFKPPRVAA